jgi:hypothetical protein
LIVELRAMMHTPIAAYKPKPDEEPKPSNYTIDAIGISADEVSDEVNFYFGLPNCLRYPFE